jgi:hypothetical protein
MRVGVTGGRKYRNRAFVYATLDQIDREEGIDCLIEGEAPGLDKLARQWAESRGVPFHPFKADWDNIDHPQAIVKRTSTGKLYDAGAGRRRNRKMLFVGRPHVMLGFPGGAGTYDMMVQTVEAGITLRKMSEA